MFSEVNSTSNSTSEMRSSSFSNKTVGNYPKSNRTYKHSTGYVPKSKSQSPIFNPASQSDSTNSSSGLNLPDIQKSFNLPTPKDTTQTKLFVGGLPYHTTDATLKSHFDIYGEIEEAVVITDRNSGKSRGYGFVTMKYKNDAAKACLNPNPIIDGRKANVNLAYIGAKPRIIHQNLLMKGLASTIQNLNGTGNAAAGLNTAEAGDFNKTGYLQNFNAMSLPNNLVYGNATNLLTTQLQNNQQYLVCNNLNGQQYILTPVPMTQSLPAPTYSNLDALPNPAETAPANVTAPVATTESTPDTSQHIAMLDYLIKTKSISPDLNTTLANPVPIASQANTAANNLFYNSNLFIPSNNHAKTGYNFAETVDPSVSASGSATATGNLGNAPSNPQNQIQSNAQYVPNANATNIHINFANMAPEFSRNLSNESAKYSSLLMGMDKVL